MNNLPDTAKFNEAGHLEIGQCDTGQLARQFGTPLFILDEATIRNRAHQYIGTLKKIYPDSLVIYASKALCNTAVLKITADCGMGVDVSSGGELYTAEKAGLDLSLVYFHGNNKSTAEIAEGIQAGCKFVVDNFKELENLDKLSHRLKKKVDILFRVNPGIEAHTHEFIQTGQIDSKFGIQKNQVLTAVAAAQKSKYLNFIGLHTHIGSQILDIQPFVKEADILFDLAAEIRDNLDLRVQEMNFGGGFGVCYTDDAPPKISQLLENIVAEAKKKTEELKLAPPKIVFEPGRSIIANAGITLYTISYVKEIPGIRKYAMIDGGMSDNPRPILYGAKYDAVIANKGKDQDQDKDCVRIAGRFCESGDILIKDIELVKIDDGDLLAVFATGAYNYSMASNYNRVPRPAIVLVSQGKPTLILKRETYEDLIRGDIII